MWTEARSSCEGLRQDQRDGFRVDGLGNMVIHARGKAALPILVQGVGSQGDDGDLGIPRGRIFRPDAPGRFEAVHFRHLHIHENGDVIFLGHGVHDLVAVGHHIGPVPDLVEHQTGDLLVDGIVLGQEHERFFSVRAHTGGSDSLDGGHPLGFESRCPVISPSTASSLPWWMGIVR